MGLQNGHFSGVGILRVEGRNLTLERILQENGNTPPEHTPGNPPSQLCKESRYSLLVKVARGVFQFGVLKQP